MKHPNIKLSKTFFIIGGVVMALMLAMGGTSAYAASTNALPGSALYPFKQDWEALGLLLATNPAAKANRLVAIARDRIQSSKASSNSASQTAPAIQEAQKKLNSALEQSNKVTDPTTRKAINDSISKESAEAETELEQNDQSGQKPQSKDTSNQLKEIKDQAETDN